VKALPFTLKNIYLKVKTRNYGSSNISPCKNTIFSKTILSKETLNPSRYYDNSIITKLKFQHKPKYHVSKISSNKKIRPIIMT
jgi:hypothetical protein